ncbi:lytic transglycosylase domain-containing protein [Paraburkholderia sp. RP-4-7]|jgi:soluble lytic murein transglycosylase-like protein|uniref:Lytic transglycosylase domain-containing protein n=1 Tax=Paraburkholderia polaris TaxID=2728848 RepID=A0A848ISI1_9BURK|nr:lytic transglycosylase domain-containing protein [Paraburkholderia polaris]
MKRMPIFAAVVCVGIACMASTGARADCLDDAAIYFDLDPMLVRAIAKHESGMRADAVNRNRNGSYDIGLMQINTVWLPRLQEKGITAESLRNPCVNGYVGAWILRSNVERFGQTWKAVGAYNASSSDKQLKYANSVYSIWTRLRNMAFEQRTASAQ